MIRAEYLADPPVIDVVESVEELIGWTYGKFKEKPKYIVTLTSLNAEESRIKDELRERIINIVDPDESSGAGKAEWLTTNGAVLAIKQAHDTSKMINGVYTALQGRDKTRRITGEQANA